MTLSQIRRLIGQRAYLDLSSRLAVGGLEALTRLWPELGLLEKLTVFKLLRPPRAFQFYSGIDVEEKYLLLSGFDLNSIAPVLEDLPSDSRSLFWKLPSSYYNRMLHALASEQVEAG